MSATKHLLAASLALGLHLAPAQSQPVVTEADIARAAKSQPKITDADVEAARKKYRMPSDAEIARVPVPSTPNIDALPQPLTKRQVDLGAIASGFEQISPKLPASQAAEPAVFIFVSLGMPEASLQHIFDQAARARATVVVRGFVEASLPKTAERIRALIGKRRVAVQIDPQAFDRYAVTKVPSFVLARLGTQPAGCGTAACNPPEGFVKAAGDVSLDYALEFFQRSAPAFGRDAGLFLKRLRG